METQAQQLVQPVISVLIFNQALMVSVDKIGLCRYVVQLPLVINGPLQVYFRHHVLLELFKTNLHSQLAQHVQLEVLVL